MKKILKIIAVILCLLCLFGCQKEDRQGHTVKAETSTLGGWELSEKELDNNLQEIFNKAMTDYTSMSFRPLKLVGTQVVAGTNYKFYCEGSANVTRPQTKNYYVTIYQDLQGNCSIIDISEEMFK